MASIQDRQEAVAAARKRLGWSTPRAADEAMKFIRAAGAELNVSQQSVSDFENSKARKRIPAWLKYLEQALGIAAAEAPPASEGLDELEALLLEVISTPGSETKQPRELAKILAGAARDYFGRGQPRQTKTRIPAPTAPAGRQAAARSRGPNS